MEHSSFDLIDHNAKIFFKPKLASWYAREPLNAAEAIILIRHREAYAGKAVLDIGVGSGRTTRYLLPFAKTYLGIDVSPSMLDVCRQDWPTADIMELDLRDLGVLGRDRFDFIFGSSAVLDVLTHEARVKAFAECVDLLAPEGLFVFSLHNLHYEKAGLPPALDLSGSPIRMPIAVASFVRHRLHHHRMKSFEQREDDYALLRDIAHGWKGVFYYTDRATQTQQIEAAGLTLIECLGNDGQTLALGADDSQHGLLHFICKKPAAKV